MSLKALHIVFISTSVLLVVGLGIWQLSVYFASGAALSLVWGLTSLGGAVLLVIYGINFLKKLKKISML